MLRRQFIAGLAAQSLALYPTSLLWGMGEKKDGSDYGITSGGKKPVTTIGKRSLEDIRDVFHHELYDLTIPLWKKQGVDWKYGGYFDNYNERDEIVGGNKRLYYQSRILWLYSYFYTHFDQDEFHLRAAKAGFDFLKNYCVDDKYDWFTEVTREGKPVTKFFDIYASIYMVLGLGEYYRASGVEEARDLAVKSAYRVNEIILSPTYLAPGHGRWYEPGTKRLGTWLHYLNALTPLLRYTADPGLEQIAKMCVRNMLNHHWQPDIGYAFEALQHDFTPYPDDLFIDDESRTTPNSERWVNNFHTMEAAWMIMDEALRTGNRRMFEEGMKFGRVHLEKCWVERNGQQGLVQFFRPDDPESFERGEICKPYVIKEVFILLLLALEHSGEQWAADWFDRAFGYSYGKPLDWPYRDTLHQPRGVMFCLEILNRMIERKGKVSDYFDRA